MSYEISLVPTIEDLTMRDYFAVAAMQKLLEGKNYEAAINAAKVSKHSGTEWIAFMAYAHADAMLKQRSK